MKSLINRLKDERGFAIVEATLIFPVVFFVLFFIIYIGNIYYLMSQIDGMAIRHCINGAESVADPMHYDLANLQKSKESLAKNSENNEGGFDQLTYLTQYLNSLSAITDSTSYPYRYIFPGFIKSVEKDVTKNVEDELKSNIVILFDSMRPMSCRVDVRCDNYFVYSKFVVDISYEVPFPLKLFDNNEITMFRRTAHAEVAVNDSPEFVRNVDMVVDLLEDTKVGDFVKGVFSKVSDFLNMVKGAGEEK